MSTTYHSAITNGAAANASTFNTPLGTLDAAIAAANAARVSGDGANAALLEDEEDARIAADAAEASARTAADNAEASTRAAADAAEVTARNAAIATETNARIADVNTESNARAAADAAEVTARNAAIAAEATARGAADDVLDERIDNIVAATGDDIVEVVDARGAGNVKQPADTLGERLEWLEGAQSVYAAAYGFHDGGTAAANLTALNLATAAAAAFDAPAVVWMPAGRFACDNVTVPANVLLRGARMPYHDRANGVLEGGTVISGATVTLSSGSGLMDLGVQVTTAKNAITGAGSDCLLVNVATLGSGTQHGYANINGARSRVANFYAAELDHGVVFKGQFNVVSNLVCWNCGISSLTLKSDAGQDCIGNLIIGIHSDGTAAGDAGGIWLDALSPYSVMHNVIMGLNFHNVGDGVFAKAVQASGYLCRYNRVVGGTIRSPSVAGIRLFSQGSVAGDGPDYNDFSDLTVIDSGGYSFLNQYGGDNNSLHGGRSITPTSGDFFGNWLARGINGAHGALITERSANNAVVEAYIRNTYALDSSTNEAAALVFQFANTTGDVKEAARIQVGKAEDFSVLVNQSGYISFWTRADGDDAERMRISKLGNVGIGETVPETALHINGALTVTEQAANPADPTAGASARAYMKGDKWIIQYNHGGTVKYRYLTLTSTDATWTYTTTPP
jgi:hypothetical protein